MKSGSSKISVLGIGQLGSGFAPTAFADGVHGLVDKERFGHDQVELRNGHGARNVTPSLAQVAEGSAGKGPQDALRQVIANMFDRAGNALAVARAEDGVLLVVHDDLEVVKEPIAALKSRHLAQRIISLTSCRAGHAGAGCGMLTSSAGTNPLTASIHFSDASPFAMLNSPRRQNAFLVGTHNGLATAPLAWAGNPSMGDVFESLGSGGSCIQLAFHSLPLSSGRTKRVWGQLGRALGGSYAPAVGDLNDLLAQSRACTYLAHEPAARTTDDPIDLDLPRFVVYIAPFPPGEQFLEFVERQTVSLAQTYPNARPVFASGNGTPLLEAVGERFVQVSVLAPLPGPRRSGN